MGNAKSSIDTESVAVEFASVKDARYDEDSGLLTRDDLPVDFFDGVRDPVGFRNIHWNGALYADGQVVLAGSPKP